MARDAASPGDHLRARLLTGSAARALAFAIDFCAAVIRTARGNPEHPEERRAPQN